MKKILKPIAALALCACASTGCVENSSYVILSGVTTEECDTTSDDLKMINVINCGPTAKMVAGAQFALQVRSYISSDSGWSSSSGSSSGTSFEPEPPNRGLIYVTEVVTSCGAIDGDEKACKGKEPISVKINAPIAAGSGACIGYFMDIDTITGWGGSKTLSFDIRIKYKDAGGLMKGESSASRITMNIATACEKSPFASEDSDSGSSADSGGASASGGSTDSGSGSGSDSGTDKDKKE